MTLREQTQERERITLSPLACRSAESRGRVRPEEECDIRTPFQRCTRPRSFSSPRGTTTAPA